MRSYPHVLAALFDQPWAITPRYLETMIARMEQAGPRDLEAVAAKLGRPLENTGNRVERRGSTAILDVTGPIFRYANVMTELSGATSIELLSRDFQAALDDPKVESILFRVDSPGGEVNGVADFAEMIRAGNERKPVTAFIDGLGASAAYWLASAAGKVYGSVDSFSGSIGIVATLTDRRPAQERQGVKTYQIVSSNAPRKLVDPATEDGAGAILEMVDSLSGLFVDAVARYRKVEASHVVENFGRGFVLPARLAEKNGMIDGVTNEEALIASLNGTQPAVVAGIAAQEETMEKIEGTAVPQTPPPTAVADQERQRIQAILALPDAQERRALAQVLAFEPGMTAETAQRILAAAAKETPPAPEPRPLERAMGALANPKVGIGATEQDDASVEAARILAFIPPHQRARPIS